MKKLTLFLILATISSQGVFAQAPKQSPKQQMLQQLYDMRQRLERESRQEENEARANVGSVRVSAGDSPTVSGMRREMGMALSQISNNYRCLDVDVENNGGNTVIVCGNNNGSINGENTTAAGNVIGAVNTVIGGPGAGGSQVSSSGPGGAVNVGPLGNPVYNSGTYVETSSNSASNSTLVEGNVNGLLSQTNTQANGDIGDRTVIVDN